MKIRSLLALAGLAISFAVPTFAQQQNAPDPKLREQAESLHKKVDEALNNNDAAALASFYTEDAVFVVPEGPIYGREAIAKFWVDMFQKVHFSNRLSKLDQYSPHTIGTAGNEMWENGAWTEIVKGENFGPMDQKGYWSGIIVREGDDWKFRFLAVTFPPPEPAKTK